ncbi:MAG: HEPN domain-containing protein [Bacteroidales bacterium]|nr:HEPN domain-containing protein [Bacteroidales bacterium]
MEKRDFDKDKLIRYWSDSSDDDFDTMIAMFESKKFNWALFIGHLMIEKLLKALYVKTKNDYPPFLHNLLRLAEKCDLELSDDQKLFFVTTTAFNINARYDDYKMSFQQKCTPEFTAIWIENLKINRQWIKELIQ